MKRHTLKLTAMLAVLAMLPVGWALAAMPIAFMVNGTVTSVAGNQVVIDGKAYKVQTQGPALHDLEAIHPGEKVQVFLNGPPGAAGSQVVAINVQKAR